MSAELEQLVGRAVMDPEFRGQVLDDPEGAAKSAGFNLADAELDQLKEIVERYRKHAEAGSFDALGGKLGAW
ncbi:MAG TPA: Franean1_4349 family RiPP [Herpetosiphonaceae bacterium]|nr:Franean1_4349 family RiPP [Herpetosiphonaceae bacterium]